MPTIQFDFPIQHLGTGDSLRLSIKFETNIILQHPPEIIYNASDLDIYITDLGSLEHEYNLEDFFVSPPFYDLKLSVPENSDFARLLYDKTTPFSLADKRAEVKLEIMYEYSTEWEIEFLGYFIEEEIEYDPDTTMFSVTCAPKTDIINRKMLVDLSGGAINPFEYPSDFGGHTYMGRLGRILNDAYKSVDPEVNVQTIHNWLFRGLWNENYTASGDGDFLLFPFDLGEPPVSPTVREDIQFAELYQDIRKMFHNPTITTLGDLLRKLAIDWGCFTGMLNTKNAFFKSLFDTNGLYELDDETYYNRKLKYQLPLLSHVRYELPNSTVHELGTFTGLEGSYLRRDSMVGFGSSFTNILTSLDHTYDIVGVKDNRITTSYIPYGNLITQFWYNLRSNQASCRVDPVITPGLNHSIIKNYQFKNNLYQPLRVKKRYKEGYTELDGLLIG